MIGLEQAGALHAPRALHGRDESLLALLAALEADGVRGVIVRGPAGVGKTALVEMALSRLARGGALTGAGKHPEGETARDLAPLIEALEAAVGAGLDTLYDPDSGLSTLRQALGARATALATFSSGLLRGLADSLHGAAISAAAAEENVALAVLTVLRWLEGFEQPIVLFIDDWNRAGPRARALYERLLQEAPPLARIVAAERVAADAPHPPVQRHDLFVMDLGPLRPAHVRAVVRDMLGGQNDAADRLAANFTQERNLPFDIVQTVRRLEAAGALRLLDGEWRFDAHAATPVFAENLYEAIGARLEAAPQSAKDLAAALAVFGEAADLADVAAAAELDASETAEALGHLGKAGLVVSRGVRIAFAHDRIQSAAISAIDAAARADIAARIADRLRRTGAGQEGGDKQQLMLRRCLDGGLDRVDPLLWAPLFALGAEAARRSADQNAADTFAESAYALAKRTGRFSHAILSEAAFAAIGRGAHEAAKVRADAMLAAAQTPIERAEADEMRVFAARMAGDTDGAIRAAREGLTRAGLRTPENPTWIDVIASVLRVRFMSVARAERVSPMGPSELAAEAPMMRAIGAIGTLLFEKDIKLAIVLCARAVPFRVAAGSAVGAAALAVTCSLMGASRRAERWSERALKLHAPGQPLRATTLQFAARSGLWRTRSRTQLRSIAEEVMSLAFEEGDLGIAAYANRDRVHDALLSDLPLEQTAALADRALQLARRLRDHSTASTIAAVRQCVELYQRGGPTPWRMEGEFYSPAELDYARGARLRSMGRTLVSLEAQLAAVFGVHEVCAALYNEHRALLETGKSLVDFPTWTFNTGISLYRLGEAPADHALRRLQVAARRNPRDNKHRLLALRAERSLALGRKGEAVSTYALAVQYARQSECLIEYGVVAAAAAEAAQRAGHGIAAARFDAAASDAWSRFGAHAVALYRRRAEPSLQTYAARAQPPAEPLDRRAQEIARQAAERANAAKSRFLAMIGHELRTPLQGMQGLVDLANDPGDLDLEELRGALTHLRVLVGDLTDWAALDADVLRLTQKPFSIITVVRGVARQQAARAPDRHVRLTVSGPNAEVLGDEARLRQVLTNLVANALAHGQGEVDLTVRIDAPPDGPVAATFEVGDEGPGLAPAELARLFEPFERGAVSGEGLGLGLAISRRLVMLMGGDLIAEMDGGARFSFKVAWPPAATRRAQKPDAPSRVRSGRVLLVEDNALSRRVLRGMFEAAGSEVIEAVSAGEGAAAAQRTALDLCVIDYRLPDFNGLALARRLRAGGYTGRIVIATAGMEDGAEQPDPALHIEAVLTKPVSFADVGALVGQKMERDAPPPRIFELRLALGAAAQDILKMAEPQAHAAHARLRAALARGEREAAAEEAHALRGLAAHIGLHDLSNAAGALEQDLRASRDHTESARAFDAVFMRTDWTAFALSS